MVFLDAGSWEKTGQKQQGYILHVVLDAEINGNNQEKGPVRRAHWNSHLVTFSANLVSRTVTRWNDSHSVRYECMPYIYGISVWKGCVYVFKGMNSICKLLGVRGKEDWIGTRVRRWFLSLTIGREGTDNRNWKIGRFLGLAFMSACLLWVV